MRYAADDSACLVASIALSTSHTTYRCAGLVYNSQNAMLFGTVRYFQSEIASPVGAL